MYRDSQLGPCIDLSGPDGNAYFLLGYASNLAKQIWPEDKKKRDAISAEMRDQNYANLVCVFNKHFGGVVTLVNIPDDIQKILTG